MLGRHDEEDETEEGHYDDDEENLLDTFPLTLEELRHLRTTIEEATTTTSVNGNVNSVGASQHIIADDRLRVMFEQSERIVFCPNDNDNPIHRRYETIVSVCGRRGDRFIYGMVDTYMSETTKDSSSNNEAHAIESLATLLWQESPAAAGCGPYTKNDDDGKDSSTSSAAAAAWIPLLQSKTNNNDTSRWKDWLERYIPGCCRVIAAAYCRHFGLTIRSPLRLPTIVIGPDTDDIDSDNSSKMMLWHHNKNDSSKPSHWPDDNLRIDCQLALMGLAGPYRNLYDSQCHGMSFGVFEQALAGYAGPTLLIIETTDHDIVGVSTERAWHGSSSSSSASFLSSTTRPARNDFDDNDTNGVDYNNHAANSSCLFRLSPQWTVYRQKDIAPSAAVATNTTSTMTPATENKRRLMMMNWHHQYLNRPRHHHHRVGNNLDGLAIGGYDIDTPRLHLTVDLDEHCRARSMDMIYDEGNLLSSEEESFTPAHIQVWAACADEKTFDRYQTAGRTKLQQREQLRHRVATIIDKSEFVNDQIVVESKALFGHRQQMPERVDDEAVDVDTTTSTVVTQDDHTVDPAPPESNDYHHYHLVRHDI